MYLSYTVYRFMGIKNTYILPYKHSKSLQNLYDEEVHEKQSLVKAIANNDSSALKRPVTVLRSSCRFTDFTTIFKTRYDKWGLNEHVQGLTIPHFRPTPFSKRRRDHYFGGWVIVVRKTINTEKLFLSYKCLYLKGKGCDI